MGYEITAYAYLFPKHPEDFPSCVENLLCFFWNFLNTNCPSCVDYTTVTDEENPHQDFLDCYERQCTIAYEDWGLNNRFGSFDREQNLLECEDFVTSLLRYSPICTATVMAHPEPRQYDQ